MVNRGGAGHRGLARAHVGELLRLYMSSCCGGEVTTIAHVGHKSQGMGRRGGAQREAYGGDVTGWAAR
jgi:hypothetical protein